MPKCKGKARRGRYSHREKPEFWEQKLKRMGLTEDAGHSRSVITYGHMIEDFGELEGRIVYSPPAGERLDSGEWLISLP